MQLPSRRIACAYYVVWLYDSRPWQATLLFCWAWKEEEAASALAFPVLPFSVAS
jgi:hypothetical protein